MQINTQPKLWFKDLAPNKWQKRKWRGIANGNYVVSFVIWVPPVIILENRDSLPLPPAPSCVCAEGGGLMEESMSQLSLHSDVPPDVSKQRKKKKKKSRSKALSLLANSPLPSQKFVEARFPWKIIVRSGRGRCAIATRYTVSLLLIPLCLQFLLSARVIGHFFQGY